MSVSFLHGAGSLVCDGIDAGHIEFSIAEPSDGPDTTRRGKLGNNKQAIATAMDAEKVELKLSDDHELLSLDVARAGEEAGEHCFVRREV